jgi:hypothetical protein
VHPELRTELAARIAQVAKGISAKPDAETGKILEELAGKLKGEGGDEAAFEAVSAALRK